jgi:2-dehydropantoate 2-reductase
VQPVNRIYVVGAGAIGGLIGIRLQLQGYDVTFIDRGPHLEAMQRTGLRLIDLDGIEHNVEHGRFAQLSDSLPPPQVLFLATKAHDIPPIAERLAELIGPDTAVVTVQNGLPWWYFQGMTDQDRHEPLRSVDPDGLLSRCIPARSIIGCVAYPAAEVPRPGVVRHVEGTRFALGELDGSITPRLQAIASMLDECGLRARVLEDIRSELWVKAWGTMSLNPIGALTGATLAGVCRDRRTRELVIGMMREGERVAAALGVKLRVSLERRLAGAESVGEHKTSMLQDLEAGRAMEVDALLGSIVELGQRMNVPMPLSSAVYGLLQLRNRTAARDGSAPAHTDAL